MIPIIGFKFNTPIIYNNDPYGTLCTAERYPLTNFFLNKNIYFYKPSISDNCKTLSSL
ncbi:hypothetical protein FWK35_00013800 [Aphis craccivora]|uniref:Uncharacterized protein n=1 Tax=Aphis craccivora TaxID=307492 RepID=A0A6G0YQ09_APHCR|nr:hypothetical protein FWK35_00013800 [Aphis craccivora]